VVHAALLADPTIVRPLTRKRFGAETPAPDGWYLVAPLGQVPTASRSGTV
jgi:hypothetical protein